MNENTSAALALIPKGLEEAEKMSLKLSESTMLPEHFRKQPANVFWALAYGLEIGLTPVQSLQAIYVVHGRPGMYADAMVALIITSGKAEYFHCVESDAKHATYETQRKGSPKPRVLTITIDEAQQAGWTSNAKYKTEPRRMLEARCKSQLARDVYPDVLRGMTAAEDLEDDGAGGPRFTAPPAPSKGAIIDITEAKKEKEPPHPPPTQSGDPAVPPPVSDVGAPSKDDELKAEAMDIIRGIHESTSVSDLGAQLDPMRVLFGKLGTGPDGKATDLEKDVRKQYTAKKRQLEKAEGSAA